jgi:hypothetical protein
MTIVRLLPPMSPEESASLAALTCYTSKPPEIGKQINVKERLFDVSHHTTLQHKDTYFSFFLDNVAVGDVTFGLHLVSPFYNTDQRSGRYAGKMFSEPDFHSMMAYVMRYWADHIDKDTNTRILKYLTTSVEHYTKHKEALSTKAERYLKKERPYIKENTVAVIAPKVAQEQLRMYIPILFPTALVYTLNLTALVALYEEAWTPSLKAITSDMANLVMEKYPELSYMFDSGRRRYMSFSPNMPRMKDVHLKDAPYVKDCTVSGEDFFTVPDTRKMHPVDRLRFTPELMENSIGDIRLTVGMSVATMGQDQRHRTIDRGMPRFTGGFYLPPLLYEEPIHHHFAERQMEEWIAIAQKIPSTLATILAPYGAMIEYKKKGSFNAVAHEQHKRLCWCAQEEIYYLGVLLRKTVGEQCGNTTPLLSMFQPPCFESGKCGEGDRYCGRILNVPKKDFFPRRKV